MSNQPSVFISSTVKEFRDLRSAIAFTLQQLGFSVYLSEAADFYIKGDRTAFEECFGNISKCDYYILLVGNSRGSLYEEGVSITRQEYRVARNAFISLNKPRMFLFLRNETEISMKLTDEQQNEAEIDYPDHLRSFVCELQNPGIEGAPSYLKRFTDFKDIMQALSGSMNLGRNLPEHLIRHALLSELLSNLTRLCRRSGSSVIIRHHLMGSARKHLKLLAKDIGKKVEVEDKLLVPLEMALIGRTRGDELSTKIIEEAIKQGIFLIYDSATGKLQESKLRISLKQIDDDIQLLRQRDSNMLKDWDSELIKDIEKYRSRVSALNNTTGFTMTTTVVNIASALMYYDNIENIFNGHLSFCRVLLGLDEDIQQYERLSRSAFGDIEENKILKEKVSEVEISHLIQNDIDPLGTKVLKDVFGATEEEQKKCVEEYLKSKVNLSKEVIEIVARKYIDNLIEPAEGIENLDNL